MEFALPDLAGFAAASLLLVLAVAIGLLAALIGNTLGNAPVIGGWVKRDLVGWMTDARNAVLKSAGATWHFATGMTNWLLDVATKPLLYMTEFALRAWQEIETLKNQIVPEAVAAAETWARTEIATEVNGLLGNIEGQVNAIRGDIATAEAVAAAGIHSVQVAVSNAEATAIAHANALAGGLLTDVDTWGNVAVHQVWPDAVGDIEALRNTLGADFPDIRGLLGDLAGAGALGLAGALIRSLAGTAVITKLADECIVPNCRNLSGLGRDLSELAGAASTAALLAWVVFLVEDPTGWAQDTYRLGGPVAASVTNAGARLFGAA